VQPSDYGTGTGFKTELGLLKNASIIAQARSTDPRDKIYGFLNLLPSEETQLIGIDNNLSCAELYAKTTLASIKYRGDFRMLLKILFQDVGPRIERLPSWAVDFNSARTAWEESLDPIAGLLLE
jgi:hypothetical protein